MSVFFLYFIVKRSDQQYVFCNEFTKNIGLQHPKVLKT